MLEFEYNNVYLVRKFVPATQDTLKKTGSVCICVNSGVALF